MIWWDGWWDDQTFEMSNIKFDISSRVPSTFSRRRSPPGWPTWSWSWSCCPTTWWPRESAQRSSVITSAASSTCIAKFSRQSDIQSVSSSGKWWNTRAHKERRRTWSSFQRPSISSGKKPEDRYMIRPSYTFLFQPDDVIWTQCPKWRWQWWSWTRRGTYRRGFRTLSSTSLIGFTSIGLVKG